MILLAELYYSPKTHFEVNRVDFSNLYLARLPQFYLPWGSHQMTWLEVPKAWWGVILSTTGGLPESVYPLAKAKCSTTTFNIVRGNLPVQQARHGHRSQIHRVPFVACQIRDFYRGFPSLMVAAICLHDDYLCGNCVWNLYRAEINALISCYHEIYKVTHVIVGRSSSFSKSIVAILYTSVPR